MKVQSLLARSVAPLGLVLALTSSAHAAPSVDLRRTTTLEGRRYAPTSDGGSVRVSLDPTWQRVAERLLETARAPESAIVVSDVRTGKIIAWASRGGGRDYVSTAFAPSASLFKVVTATALLESGKASPSTRQCYGMGGEHSVHAQDVLGTSGPTCTTLGDGLGRSINLVFARLAHRFLSPSDLRRSASSLGFGGAPMIDIAAPKSEVFIPDDEVGMARAAAGFGDSRLSPLTALGMMQTIANGGERVQLSVLADSPQRVSLGRAMSEKTALELKHMLEGTTVHGTCAKVFHKRDGSRVLPHTSVAAKTGTLVTSKPLAGTSADGKTRMFSWFAGFAPVEKPEVAIAVMLGNDVRWWEKANEVGRDFLKAYFERGSSSAAVASRGDSASRAR